MDVRIQLLLWVAASLAAGLVACIAYRARGEHFWREDPSGGVIAEVALFAYHVGVPFLALIAGSLSLDLLGLGTDWFSADHLAGFTLNQWLTACAAASCAAGLVLLVLRLNRGSVAVDSPDEHGLTLARNAVYDELHWALYRSPFILLFGDALFGAVAGGVLVGLEWVLRGAVTQKPMRPGHRLVTAMCVTTSAFLYVTTQNLWLMIAAHIAIRALARRMLTPTTAPRPHASSQ